MVKTLTNEEAIDLSKKVAQQLKKHKITNIKTLEGMEKLNKKLERIVVDLAYKQSKDKIKH